MPNNWVSLTARIVISHTELIKFPHADPLLGFDNYDSGSAFGSSNKMLDNRCG